jgi:RNA recognition motif-containing protein
MGSKIYVGGLPYSTNGQQLEYLFATHGTVESAWMITDKFTGRSRGSALWKWPQARSRLKRLRR